MNFEDRLIAFTDLETTGLEKFRNHQPLRGDITPWHEIIEIGLVLINQKTLEVMDQWETKTKIQYPKRMSDKAQEVNGYDPEQWLSAMELEDALREYAKRTENADFAAHNNTFDWGFLEVASVQCGVPLKMDYHRIDLYTYAKAVLDVKGYKLESYRLSNLAEFLKLGKEPLPHRALNGAMKAYEVYKALRALPVNKTSEVNPASGCQVDPVKKSDESESIRACCDGGCH